MAQPFVVDRRGAFLVALLGMALLPGLCAASVASLLSSWGSGGSWVLLIPAVFLIGLGGYFFWATLREIRGAWGIRIDDDGIHSARVKGGVLPWAQVLSVESLSFGVWKISGPGGDLRICAYMFESREKLSRLVRRRGPGSF